MARKRLSERERKRGGQRERERENGLQIIARTYEK